MFDVRYIMITIDLAAFDEPEEAATTTENDPPEDLTFTLAMAEDLTVMSVMSTTLTKVYKLLKDTVCADSGAASNIFNYVKWFNEVIELRDPVKITSATGGIN